MKQRTQEERIAELQAKIDGIKQRGERKKARGNPTVKLTVQAVKLLDRALNETQDGTARKTIEDARGSLAAFAGTHGWVMPVAGSTTEKAVKAPKRGRRKNNVAMSAS